MSQGAAPSDSKEREGLAVVILDGPRKGNTLNGPMLADLNAVTDDLVEDPELRAVLVRAEGPDFCFGADVHSFTRAGGDLSATLFDFAASFHRSMTNLSRVKVPLVAAVQGGVAGGGISIACVCDVVLAADSARFAFAYPRIGLSPDGGLSLTLPRLVGIRRALDWALSGEVLPAQAALEWGLISRIVAAEELHTKAEEVAQQLAEGPTLAFAATKRLFRESWSATLDNQLASEASSISSLGRSRDAQTGIHSFLARQAPDFLGC